MKLLSYNPAKVTEILAGFPDPDKTSEEPRWADEPYEIRLMLVKPAHGWVTERLGVVRNADRDVALAAVAGVVGGRVEVSRRYREVVVLPEKRWTQDQVLARLEAVDMGIAASTWRAYVARGEAPRPVEAKPNRWSEADIESWIRRRPGKGGRPVSDVTVLVGAVLDHWVDPHTWEATSKAQQILDDEPDTDRAWRIAEALKIAAGDESVREAALVKMGMKP